MADSWESKFPHPGLGPGRPAERTLDPAITYPYNDWVRKMRKHNVAKAVDMLVRKEQASIHLDPVETIALTLGVVLLDGSSPDHDTSIFGMFGGLLG